MKNYPDAIAIADDNGKLIINKQNLDYEDMDNLSRALSITLDKSDLRFMNTVKAVNRLSDNFKDILDNSNPLIKDARIQSAKSFRIEEIYKKAEKDFKNIRPSEFILIIAYQMRNQRKEVLRCSNCMVLPAG